MTRRLLPIPVLAALAVFAGTSSTAFATAPAAPSECFAVAHDRTASAATVDVVWTDNSTNETQWQIQVSVDSGPYSVLGTIQSGALSSVTWSAAPLDKVLRFKVSASNGTEVSAESNVATVGTFDLGAPISLTASAVDSFNVSMKWDEQSTSESGFSIERKAGSGAWTILGTLGANTVRLSPGHLIWAGTTFQFRVRAYKGTAPTTPDSPPDANVSAYSNTVSITSPAYPLAATAVPGQRTINLSWSDVLNESRYDLYALLPGYYQWSKIAEIPANSTAYQATAPLIKAASSYSFILVPYDLNGYDMGESSIATVSTDGITSKTGTSGNPGQTFSHTFAQANTSAVVSRSLTNIPAGLAFNPATGALTGVYPAVGNYAPVFSVTLANGATLTQTFSIRVRPPAGPPQAGTALAAWSGAPGATASVPLAGAFTDAEEESAVRVTTTIGAMDIVLFDTATPATVANFMAYANSGKYDNTVFHRAISGFMAQGGGFRGTGTGANFTSVATYPAVANEPGISNVRRTVAMAKTDLGPDTATNQFFVSVNDNSSNLDYQNGGFTVFGRVAGDGMAVPDAITGLPSATYNLFMDGSSTATPFADFPMNAASAPSTMDQTKTVKILSVVPVAPLALAVSNNTNAAVATGAVSGGQLVITALAPGQTTLTVTATDRDGLTASQTVPVTVSDTYATWAARNAFPGNQSAPSQNPDGDSFNNLMEYALLGNPAVSSQTPAPTVGSNGSGSAKTLTLTFPVRKFTTGLTYVVEANNQLSGTWEPVWSSTSGFTGAQVLTSTDLADRTQLTIRDTAAIASRPTRFMRLRVTQD